MESGFVRFASARSQCSKLFILVPQLAGMLQFQSKSLRDFAGTRATVAEPRRSSC
jgi:hypothetical protein